MNHPKHDHAAHHQEKPSRKYHKDWRVWVAVIAILVAMAAYVLTNEETLMPGGRSQQPTPIAPAP